MPVPNVTTGDVITEAWGDAVADAITALETAPPAHTHTQVSHSNAVAAASDYLARIKLAADAQYRYQVALTAADVARLSFGPGGATAPDTHLYRDAAGRAIVDTSLVVGGPWSSANVGQATAELWLAIERAWRFRQTPGTAGAGAALSLQTMINAKPFDFLNSDDSVGLRVVMAAAGGGLEVRRALGLNAILTPANLAANADNYAPAGGPAATVWRINPTASRTISGIDVAASVDILAREGRVILIQNVSATLANTLILAHESASSLAANRFLCPNNANVTIRANGSALVVYDDTSDRWRVVAI